MDEASGTCVTATAALVLSTAALLISLLVWWSTLRDRRQQRQIAMAQKRSEVLAALNEIEMVLKPAIRDVQTLQRLAVPETPNLQPAFDGMTEILDTAATYHKKLSDAIAPGQSSQKVLVMLEFLLGELTQKVAKARNLRALVAKAMDVAQQNTG